MNEIVTVAERLIPLIREFRPRLAANARTRSVARMLLRQPAPSLGAALPQGILMQAAVDIMPR